MDPPPRTAPTERSAKGRVLACGMFFRRRSSRHGVVFLLGLGMVGAVTMNERRLVLEFLQTRRLVEIYTLDAGCTAFALLLVVADGDGGSDDSDADHQKSCDGHERVVAAARDGGCR